MLNAYAGVSVNKFHALNSLMHVCTSKFHALNSLMHVCNNKFHALIFVNYYLIITQKPRKEVVFT